MKRYNNKKDTTRDEAIAGRNVCTPNQTAAE